MMSDKNPSEGVAPSGGDPTAYAIAASYQRLYFSLIPLVAEIKLHQRALADPMLVDVSGPIGAEIAEMAEDISIAAFKRLDINIKVGP